MQGKLWQHAMMGLANQTAPEIDLALALSGTHSSKTTTKKWQFELCCTTTFLTGINVESVPNCTKEHSFNAIGDFGFLVLPFA